MTIEEFIGFKAIYNPYDNSIWGRRKQGLQLLCDVLGEQSIFFEHINDTGKVEARKALIFYDKLGKFIAEAITEKVTRNQNIMGITAEERAEKLFAEFYAICMEYTEEIQCTEQAKRCAILHCKNMEKFMFDFAENKRYTKKYWKEVIENLEKK